jgi:hypothetical protein
MCDIYGKGFTVRHTYSAHESIFIHLRVSGGEMTRIPGQLLGKPATIVFLSSFPTAFRF